MRIAIVGAHRWSKLEAPFDDPRWEIWTCSKYNENELPRQDVWFELHKPHLVAQHTDYCVFLPTLPIVYMQAHDPAIPGSRPYPLDEILARFGPHFLRWTPCYMLALAITRAPEAIGLWGFSEERVSEGFGAERLCLQHFIWAARREGIEVKCPPYLDRPTKLYGYDQYA